ncbi:hypothetical protein SDJN02_20054, partial [Cucurbita argyrosperma subsp. argyrosperma]
MKDEADSAFEIYAESVEFEDFDALSNAVSCASTEFEIKLSHSNQLVRVVTWRRSLHGSQLEIVWEDMKGGIRLRKIAAGVYLPGQ